MVISGQAQLQLRIFRNRREDFYTNLQHEYFESGTDAVFFEGRCFARPTGGGLSKEV